MTDESEGTIVALDPADAPSVAPGSIESLIELVEQLAEAKVSGDLESARKNEDLFKRAPMLRKFVHTHAVGVRASRAAAERRGYRDGQNMARNIKMATEAIMLRRDPCWDDKADGEIISRIGGRHGFKSKQGAIDAIKDGLADS